MKKIILYLKYKMNLYDILNTKIILCKLLNNNTLPKNITSKDLLNIQLEPYLIND
jgi:hypothetical protein